MMSAEKSLAHVLKTYRLEQGMSLREFGDLLGISHAYLSKLEKGVDGRSGKEIAPTIELLLKMAERLHLSVEDFFILCGYIQEDTPDNKSEDPNIDEIIDLKEYGNEIIHRLKAARQVAYDQRLLTEADRQQVTDVLEISIELLLRQIKARCGDLSKDDAIGKSEH